MTLSVCCVTDAPGPWVAASLGPLRAVADEVVIAADARVDEDTLGLYESFADRVVRVVYEPPPERYMAWLHGLCKGDWILRVDGDEVPSRSLVDALPGLTARRDVLQFHLPRRWLYPDLGHWIDEWPWSPNYALRLVRRGPHLWFPGLLHSGPRLAFPSEFVEACIYHLDTALTPRATRAAKVAAYLATPPDLVEPSGNELTERFYLPEDHATLPPVEVPPADRALIEATGSALFAASAVGNAASDRRSHAQPRRPASTPIIPVEEVNMLWAQRRLDVDAYRASIAPIDAHRQFTVGEHRPFRLSVTNLGNERWPGGERDPLIRVAYRWLSGTGATLVPEGFRTAFPSSVGPGEGCVVDAIVAVPETPGSYVLEFDLVHEHVRWFDAPLRLSMTVKPAFEEQSSS
jgi:hypothetical protein